MILYQWLRLYNKYNFCDFFKLIYLLWFRKIVTKINTRANRTGGTYIYLLWDNRAPMYIVYACDMLASNLLHTHSKRPCISLIVRSVWRSLIFFVNSRNERSFRWSNTNLYNKRFRWSIKPNMSWNMLVSKMVLSLKIRYRQIRHRSNFTKKIKIYMSSIF